jgi:hypothetical protein
MALIQCPECGKDVSDTCKTCIHCGFTLTPPKVAAPVPEDPVISKKNGFKNNVFSFIKKHKIPAIITIAVLVIAVISLVLFFTITNHGNDPFANLYYGQTQEDVHERLGTPDTFSSNNYDFWTTDEYYDVKFLGNVGTLEVWYDGGNHVDHAYFNCDYLTDSGDHNNNPSDEDRDTMHKYADRIITYYTRKYGAPVAGDCDYEWYPQDTNGIGLDLDLILHTSDYPIELSWDNLH